MVKAVDGATVAAARLLVQRSTGQQRRSVDRSTRAREGVGGSTEQGGAPVQGVCCATGAVMTFSSPTARSLPPPLSARPSPRRPATLCRLLDDATALVRRPPLLRRPCRNGRAPSPTPQPRTSTPTPSTRYHVPTHHRPRHLPFPPPAPSCTGGGIAAWEAGGVGEEGDGRNSMATADTARRPFPHRGRRFARREAVAASAEGLQPRRPQRRTAQAVVAIRAATARPRPPQPRRHPPRPAATPLHRHCRVEAAAVRHDGDGRERRGGAGKQGMGGRAPRIQRLLAAAGAPP